MRTRGGGQWESWSETQECVFVSERERKKSEGERKRERERREGAGMEGGRGKEI